MTEYTDLSMVCADLHLTGLLPLISVAGTVPSALHPLLVLVLVGVPNGRLSRQPRALAMPMNITSVGIFQGSHKEVLLQASDRSINQSINNNNNNN
jgi:hypothetical protein